MIQINGMAGVALLIFALAVIAVVCFVGAAVSEGWQI
jgi:hypothetical protein